MATKVKQKKAPPRDRLLPPGEVANWLGISDRQLRRYSEEGWIPYVQLPRGKRYRESVIRDWIAENTVSGPAEDEEEQMPPKDRAARRSGNSAPGTQPTNDRGSGGHTTEPRRSLAPAKQSRNSATTTKNAPFNTTARVAGSGTRCAKATKRLCSSASGVRWRNWRTPPERVPGTSMTIPIRHWRRSR